jgi:hypothetical protein
MAKFDLKKAILENKATFHSSLTEGQFSWFTHDTNQQIGSEPENTLRAVYMFDNKGNKWLETNYEGYGDFGGKDYYELLAQMNGMANPDRSEGITLAFSGKKGVLYPALVVDPNFNYKTHDFTEEAPNDPNQSWYQEPEEDDYNGEDYDDEDEMYESKIKEAMDVAKDMTDQETAGHAERFAKYMSNKEGGEFVVTAGSVEGPSFDLDLDGEKYDGGSYLILTNGDIVNVAVPNKPVYANISMLDEAEKPNTKMKKSELKDKIKEMVLAEMAIDIDNMEDAPESEVDFLAEIEALLAEADEEEAPVEDETAVDDTEVAVDGEENIDVDTTAEIDPNVKAVQDSLTQAQAAAQKLGDPKLTDQIGNTITFFTRSHVVDKGAVAEGEGMDVQNNDEVEEFLDGMINMSIPEDSEEGEEVKGVWEASEYADEDAYGEAAQEFTNTHKHIMDQGGEITIEGNPDVTYKALPNGDIQYSLIVTLDEGKKKYYKDAEADDAEHIKALEKDMKDDKNSSMKIKEVVFPMWQRINK